uniref:[histone H3]-dimethyl-L-lysine(9) demethylase n=1 Tax=Anopheles epiroticus TaxID=199890 RepID=A0A182P3X5_9DIPT
MAKVGIEKKTYEQVYKDLLEQKFGGRLVLDSGCSQPALATISGPLPSPSAAPSASGKAMEEYITTVYNIIPREMSSMSVHQDTASGTILLNGTVHTGGTKRQPASTSQRASEPVLPKALPTASAPKQMLSMSKSNLPQFVLLSSDTKMANSQAEMCLSKPLPQGTLQLQLKQDRRDAPNQSLKTVAYNGERLLVANHQAANMMLTIVKPKVTTPAPGHVYGAPDISTMVQPKQYSPKACSAQQGRHESVRAQGSPKVKVEYINEPPPAHRLIPEAPAVQFNPTLNTAHSIPLKQSPNGQLNQDEALNLDTKHKVGSRRDVLMLLAVPSRPAASNSSQAPLIRSSAFVNPIAKESLLTTALAGAREPVNRSTIIVNPSTVKSVVATTFATSLQTINRNTTTLVNSGKQKPTVLATVSTSAQQPLNRTAILLNPCTKETLLRTACQSAILLNPKTMAGSSVSTSTSSAQLTLASPATLTHTSTKDSVFTVASSSVQPLQNRAAAVLTTTTMEKIIPVASTSAQKTCVVSNSSTNENNTTNKVQKVLKVPSPVVQSKAALWGQLEKFDMSVVAQLARQQLEHLNKESGEQPTKNVPKQRIDTNTHNTVPKPKATTAPSVFQDQPTIAKQSILKQPNPPIVYDTSASTMEKFNYDQMRIYEQIEAMKRKYPPKDPDPNKKRRSNPKTERPTEPFVQNGPCYKVASRLPRCRECGRSAAVRSRNESMIFCRFIAFRKLKYNNLGQLEEYGFADPVKDAKEADTNLWSSNLHKVPADLSVEKSKFLLGQVGYKFCELFHQEKEAYFEHMSEDKTIAWKQAVQGVREMCDVCQTTLFNHHWVCSRCGFVVCIDCYKCRKNGIIAAEMTAKDKDSHGWLLCSATKEPHDQTRLMLTQIIPSKCLYKLVRQMHGICALLEIPLNCECPLTREPLFRTIKDQLKFIYPLAMHGSVMESSGGEVSVTIKHIEQIGNSKLAESFATSKDVFECRIVFTQQFREINEQHNSDKWSVPIGQHKNDESSKEKQSYSFEGFVQEIYTEGDQFDERLYNISTVSKVEDKSEPTQDSADEKNGVKSLISNSVKQSSSEMMVPNWAQNIAAGVATNGSQKNPLEPECVRDRQPVQSQANGNGSSKNIPVSEEAKLLEKQPKPKETLQSIPVPYSEEDRFKPSPALDQKTFAMIIKQVVKTDKSIYQLMQPHMVNTRSQLNDFVECVSIQRARVKQFVADFLDDFILLRGSKSSDDLTNERTIVDYNRSMREGHRYRNKSEHRMNLTQSKLLYPDVSHDWLCNGKLLRLLNPLDLHNYRVFHDQWERGQPVMVSAVSSMMNMDLWLPGSFARDFGEETNDLVNCFNGKIVRGHRMKVFWDGFEEISERLLDERERPMMLKLKDWPPGDDFAEMMPTRFYDLMKSLPLAEYTRREGRLNLASRLSSFFVRPDLGPKMYSAYGSALHPTKGTTNLHLDISDAVNVMVYVGVPKDVPSARYNEKIVELIDSEDCDYLTRQRIRERKELPGALWHIYHAQDADKIRAMLNKIEIERGGTIKPNHDPIHDQKWYLDRNMRRRLQQEYQVEGYAIVQCSGDAIFIPAGAPHQVRNLHNCIKVAEDFVSPENISHCLKLTNEFRHLSGTHSNHEDKLQIKNIIYHTVKDAVSCITNPLIRMVRDEEMV